MSTNTLNTINHQEIEAIWNKYIPVSEDQKGDFFECGGDSLSAVNLIVELHTKYSVDISLEQFMRNPTKEFLMSKIYKNYE